MCFPRKTPVLFAFGAALFISLNACGGGGSVTDVGSGAIERPQDSLQLVPGEFFGRFEIDGEEFEDPDPYGAVLDDGSIVVDLRDGSAVSSDRWRLSFDFGQFVSTGPVELTGDISMFDPGPSAHAFREPEVFATRADFPMEVQVLDVSTDHIRASFSGTLADSGPTPPTAFLAGEFLVSLSGPADGEPIAHDSQFATYEVDGVRVEIPANSMFYNELDGGRYTIILRESLNGPSTGFAPLRFYLDFAQPGEYQLTSSSGIGATNGADLDGDAIVRTTETHSLTLTVYEVTTTTLRARFEGSMANLTGSVVHQITDGDILLLREE